MVSWKKEIKVDTERVNVRLRIMERVNVRLCALCDILLVEISHLETIPFIKEKKYLAK